MKKIILLIILCCPSLLLFGQHSKHPDLISADSTWGKEIIQLPFGFARDIKYTGYEDIRFAKGWGDKESLQFWTYAFVWKIDLMREPTVTFLEENLKRYFHGLMTAVNKEQDKTIPETTVLLLKKEGTKLPTFIGKVRTHDSFKTREMMTLYVLAENHYCKKSKRYMPFFRFSQQPFEQEVWKQLKGVKLSESACEN